MNNVGLILAIMVGGLVFWDLLFRLIGRLTGWRRLAGHYATEEPFGGPTWRFQSLRFGPISGYNNAITVGANAEGLYLVPSLIFRSGHAALFIPWAEMAEVKEIEETHFGRGIQAMRLVTKAEPKITLYLSKALSEKVKAAAISP